MPRSKPASLSTFARSCPVLLFPHPREAPGTIISAHRDMACSVVTSIVLKSNVTLVDIISTRMMGQYGFLATVFDAFRRHKISVDVVATSEVGGAGRRR